MRIIFARLCFCAACVICLCPSVSIATEIGRGPTYSVIELTFRGPAQSQHDTPARDIDFWVRFQHESGSLEYKIHGFWDGDGKGGSSGDVFVVRFCPTKPGRWNLAEVQANVQALVGQRQGDHAFATISALPGFWIADPDSPGRRWHMRSDGSHQYIMGNTHYTFLTGRQSDDMPSGNNIADDVIGNADYFKKLRFSIAGDRYPHPSDKPFLDEHGQPTDRGDYSFWPNPKWFRQRVDVAVQTAFEKDLIADLILAGPDTEQSRSTLVAAANNGDPTPFLKYIAARYGSYPNVWICLCNEFDIKTPRYSEADIARFGQIVRKYLPYPTALSVHSSGRTPWSQKFDNLPPWNDHQIVQNKIRNLTDAADVIQQVWQNPGGKSPRNKPTINDELSYQGDGDKHSETDTIESHLGAFLGGGYGTTGEKWANKKGQYFWGKFDPEQHSAATSLRWLRKTIDAEITFWKMSPDLGIFSNLDPGFRGMSWPEHEYVLGTNKARGGLVARLPAGKWTVVRHDIIARQTITLSAEATGRFVFDAPDSRAVLFHFKKNGER